MFFFQQSEGLQSRRFRLTKSPTLSFNLADFVRENVVSGPAGDSCLRFGNPSRWLYKALATNVFDFSCQKCCGFFFLLLYLQLSGKVGSKAAIMGFLERYMLDMPDADVCPESWTCAT